MRILLLLSFLLSVLALPAAAQDAPPVITAEVIYRTLNVRTDAVTWSAKIGELHTGDVITISHRAEIYNSEHAWVYMHHPQSNLTGWVHSQYLQFAQADWRNYVPELNYRDLRDLDYTQADELPLPQVASQNGNATYFLRAEPRYYAARIAEIPFPGEIEILANARINGSISNFVYVRERASQLEGWLPAPQLRGDGWYSAWINDNLPIIEINNAVALEGYVIASSGRVLRTEPSDLATMIRDLPAMSLVAVYGHAGDSWYYVKDVETGQVGWIHGADFPINFDRSHLPLLERVAQPALPAMPAPITAVTAQTNRQVALLLYPAARLHDQYAAANTALMLVGRDQRGRYFQVNQNGQLLWVHHWWVEVEGDTNRLPVTWRY